jgi:NAD kinase
VSAAPRAVVVTRPTEYELLLATHATVGQARFFLRTRGQQLEPVKERHDQFGAALHRVLAAVPRSWRRARVGRDALDRFLFEPDDIVIVLGPDGLVANTAKYLDGQLVIGLNPDPERYPGILVPHPPAATADLLAMARRATASIEERTMVAASLDDGQQLIAVNELFIGQRTHQSARYHVALNGRRERQSSSGIIVATGTGATGWALSINRSRATPVSLPAPTEPRLAFFVREAWPSVATGADLTEGVLGAGEALEVTSRMNTGGVVFGDGIEDDRLDFGWGRALRIEIANRRLRLVR